MRRWYDMDYVKPKIRMTKFEIRMNVQKLECPNDETNARSLVFVSSFEFGDSSLIRISSFVIRISP